MSERLHSETVEIVGAGPAGLVAAITLRRAGFRVRVYEEHKDVGHRFHGDFQGIENWTEEGDALERLGRMGIGVNFTCAPFHRCVLYGPDREHAEINTDKPLFYLVRRGPVEGSLDNGLKEQALDAGVEILFGRRMEKIGPGAITATGPKGADAVAKGVTFKTDMPGLAMTILDDNLAPGGYAYLLVHKGRATMATVLFREYMRVNECFERTKDVFQALVEFEITEAREFGGFGNFFFRGSEEHGRHLYVGECAGFQDPYMGFGIRYAMASGFLAARSIIHKKSYDRLWKEKLLPQMRASLINRIIMDRFGRFAYRYIIRKSARENDMRGFMRKVYGWSPWKWLLFPYAITHFRSRVKDERCRHAKSCCCVWCRCQRQTSTPKTLP